MHTMYLMIAYNLSMGRFRELRVVCTLYGVVHTSFSISLQLFHFSGSFIWSQKFFSFRIRNEHYFLSLFDFFFGPKVVQKKSSSFLVMYVDIHLFHFCCFLSEKKEKLCKMAKKNLNEKNKLYTQ